MWSSAPTKDLFDILKHPAALGRMFVLIRVSYLKESGKLVLQRIFFLSQKNTAGI